MRRVFRIITSLFLIICSLSLPALALIWKPPPPTTSPAPTETRPPESSVSPTPTSPPELTPRPEPTVPATEPPPASPPVGNLLPTSTPKPEDLPDGNDHLPYIIAFSTNWYEDISTFNLRIDNFDDNMQLGLEISYDEETTWCSWTTPIRVDPPYLRITFTPAKETPYYFRLVYPDGTYSKSRYVRIKESYSDPSSGPNTGDVDGSDREPQPQPPRPPSAPTSSPTVSCSPEHIAFYKSHLEKIRSFWGTHAWLPPFYNLLIAAEPTVPSSDTSNADTLTAPENTFPNDTVLDVPITPAATSSTPPNIAVSSVPPSSPIVIPTLSPSSVTSSAPTSPPPPISTEPVSPSPTVEHTPVNTQTASDVQLSTPSTSSLPATSRVPAFYTPAFVLTALFLLMLCISYFLWFKKR